MPNEDEAAQVFSQLGNLSLPQLKKIGPKLAARLDQDALSAV